MRSIVTVTAAAAGIDLTTLAAVKTELGISDKTADARLSGFVTSASRVIATHCRRVFGRETVTETFRQDRKWPVADFFPDELLLTRSPVVSIASIVEDTDPALAAGDWEADLTTGVIYRLNDDAQVRWKASKIAVAYTAGWLLPSESGRNLPEDIERACIMLTSLMWFSKDRDPKVKEEVVQGVGSTAYWVRGENETSIMPIEVLSLIDPYRVEIV